MAAGLGQTANDINTRIGQDIRTINAQALDLINYQNNFLVHIPVASGSSPDGLTLAPYNFSAEDAAAIRAAMADAALLYGLYTGAIPIVLNGTAESHDFRTTFSLLWGGGS